MLYSIFTYSNPYKINKEEYWELMKKCSQFCVSQTMVNGMETTYLELKKGQLSTVRKLVGTMFNEWSNTSTYIKQYAFIDQLITNYSINSFKSEKIKRSLSFNKSNILDSIRTLFELGILEENIITEKLSEEQKYLIDLYKEIIKTDKENLFKLKSEFDENEIEKILKEALESENENKDDEHKRNLDFETFDTVIFHGIHQFDPLMLRTIEAIAKYKKVVFLFNYQKQYQNIYQTWFDIYSCFDASINVQCNNEFKPSPILSTSYAGNKLADNIASVVEGNYKNLDMDLPKINITEFDNMTEFANYVAGIYEDAEEKFKVDENRKSRSVLSYMTEQFYAANSDVNDILKVYFPEQFGEKNFLSFPLGHFFLSITNMWDEKENEMIIENFNDVIECFTAGVIKEEIPGELASIFNKIKELIPRENKIKDIIDVLENFRKQKERIVNKNNEEKLRAYKKLVYFNVKSEEVDKIIKALQELDEISKFFYEDFENNKNNFKDFYKKVREFLEKKITIPENLDSNFKDIVLRLSSRLEDVENKIDISGSFNCLKETMNYYLQQTEEEKANSADWIVRQFEQIDGDILNSNKQNSEQVYHFACLSDSFMNVQTEDEFSWPLDKHFFELAYKPLDWKYQVFVKSRKEYKNFKRYALIYGLEFNRVNFKLSYVKTVDDKVNEKYYLLHLLNLKVKKNGVQYKQIPRHYVFKNSYGENKKDFNNFDLFKFNICPYKFLLESVLEDGVQYKSAFLILKYFEILLENKARIKLEEQIGSEVIILKNLDEELYKLFKNLKLFTESEEIDIVTNAKKYLIESVLNGKIRFSKVSEKDREYMLKKEEFIYLQLNNDNGEKILTGKFNRLGQIEFNKKIMKNKGNSIEFEKRADKWCDYCSNREICLEGFKQ